MRDGSKSRVGAVEQAKWLSGGRAHGESSHGSCGSSVTEIDVCG